MIPLEKKNLAKINRLRDVIFQFHIRVDLKIILVIKKLGSDPREKGRKLKGKKEKKEKRNRKKK